MAERSRSFYAGDEEFDEDRALPALPQDRASTNLRSPDFQKPVAEPVGTPVLPDSFNLPTAQPVAAPVVQPTLAPKPTVAPRRRYSSDNVEAQAQQLDQRTQAQLDSGYNRYLKDRGVDFEIQPDGSERVATHEDGKPRYREEASEPENVNGRWIKRHRNDRGETREVDIVAARQYQTDRETGNRYIRNAAGEQIVIGQDEDLIQQRKIKQERDRLIALKSAESLSARYLEDELEEPKQILKSLRASKANDFGETVEELENRLANRAEYDPESITEAETQLTAWKAKNPDYDTLKDGLINGETAIAERRKRAMKLDARSRLLAGDVSVAELAGILPPTLLEDDDDSRELNTSVAETVATEGVPTVEAMRRSIERMEANGLTTLKGRPIAEVKQEVQAAEETQKSVGRARSFFDTLVRGGLAEGVFAGNEGVALGLASAATALFGSQSGTADFMQRMGEYTAGMREDIRTDFPKPEDQSFAGKVLEGIGQAMATLPFYTVPYVGKALGPVHTAGQMYAEGYNDALQSGAEPEVAHRAALKYLPAAALEIASDKLLIGKLLKPLVGKISMGELAKRIGVVSTVDAITEGAQAFGLNAIAKVFEGYDPERPLTKDVVEEMAVGLFVSGTIATVVGAANNSMAPEVAPGQSGTEPTAEGATPKPPVIPPQARYESKLADLDDIRAKIATAETEGRIGEAAALADRGKAAQAELHAIANESRNSIPQDIRKKLGKIISPDLDTDAHEVAVKDVANGFALAEIGRQTRSLYVPQERETVIEALIGNANVAPSAAQTVVDQFAGTRAVGDLVNVLNNGTIEQSKAEVLLGMNLLQQVDDGNGGTKLAVTDDALALLPKGIREKAKRVPESSNLVMTPGRHGDGLGALVRAGQKRIGEAIAALPVAQPEAQPKERQFQATVDFVSKDGTPAKAQFSIAAKDADDARVQAGVRVGAGDGRRVVDVAIQEDDDLDMTPVQPQVQIQPVDPNTLSTEEKSAMIAVRREFASNTKLFQALGLKLEVAKLSADNAGLVQSGDSIIVDPPRLVAQLLNLESEAKGREWIREAMLEEVIHRAQRLAEGANFGATYQAVFQTAPAEMIAEAQKTYTGFDQLSDAAKGAELVRMVVQQRWKGSITEQIFKAVEKLLAYMKGLNLSETPMLKDAIARTEAVLKQAETASKQSPEADTTGPKGAENRTATPTPAPLVEGKSSRQSADQPSIPSDDPSTTQTATQGGVQVSGATAPVQSGGSDSSGDGKVARKGKGKTAGTGAVLAGSSGLATRGSGKAGDGKAGTASTGALDFLPPAELRDAVRDKKISDNDLTGLWERFQGAKRKIIEAEIERRSREDQAAEAAETIEQGGDDILDWIIKRGGIQISATNEVGEIKRLRENPKARRPGLFTKAGASLDDLRNMAVSRGYRMPNNAQIETVDDMLNLLEQRLNGKKMFPVIASLESDARTQGFLGASATPRQQTLEKHWQRLTKKLSDGETLTQSEQRLYDLAQDELGQGRLLDVRQEDADGQQILLASRFDPNQNAFDFGVTTQPGELQLSSAGPRSRSVEPEATSEPKAEPSPEPEVDNSQADATTPRAAAIADFGEKISGARKDVWGKYRDAINTALPNDAEDITLSKHFPEPDYALAISAGVPVESLAIFKALRDTIPAKPRHRWKLARWGELVKSLHGSMQALIAGDHTMTADQIQSAVQKVGSSTISERVKLYRALGYPAFTEAREWSIRQGRSKYFAGEDLPEYTGVTYPEYKGRTQMDMGIRDDGPTGWQEAVAKIRARIEEELQAPPEARQTKPVEFNIYSDRFTKDVFIGKKATFGVVRLKTGFETPKLARQYLEDHRGELEEQWKGMKAHPDYRRQVNAPRQGPPRRDGDVTPELFQDTFGFRGVQFGNWVEDDRRQVDLNEAFDAFVDLADVLGVPAKAMSLDGSLGLAFGARGSGGKMAAKAHYEPDLVVINLTKKSGPGSLAHEWFHAFDNYFARLDMSASTAVQPLDRFASSWTRPPQNLRPEVWSAFEAIRKVLDTGPFAERSRTLDDARDKPYYSTTIEKAARAFERLVVRKLDGKEISNDYLVNIKKDFSPALPTDEEMENGIEQAYDSLLNVMDYKPTDKGIMLFASRFDPLQRSMDFGVNQQPNELPLETNSRPATDSVEIGNSEEKTPLQLVQDNLGLAVSIAGRYSNIPGVEQDDVVSNARTALINAARAFDPSRGVPFGGFAARAIENHLNTFYGKQLRYVERNSTTLDEPIGEDGEETRGDMVEGSSGDSVSEGLEREETAALLREAIETLSGKAREAVEMRLQNRTFDEISRELGIANSTAQGIYKLATERLRKAMTERGIRGVDADGVLYAARYEGAAERLRDNQTESKPVDPKPEDREAILEAYQAAVRMNGTQAVPIADVLEGAGYNLDNAEEGKSALLGMLKTGDVVSIGSGDWSLSDNRTRAWGVWTNQDSRGPSLTVRMAEDVLAASQADATTKSSGGGKTAPNSVPDRGVTSDLSRVYPRESADILEDRPAQSFPGGVKFRTEMRGVIGEQSDLTLYAESEEGEMLGRVDYSLYNDEPAVQMILVPEKHRRKGVATALIKKLQSEHPDTEIDMGMSTEDGAGFLSTLKREFTPNRKREKAAAAIEKLKKERDELQAFFDAFYEKESPTEQDRREVNEKGPRLNNVNDRLWILENGIRNMPDGKSIILAASKATQRKLDDLSDKYAPALDAFATVSKSGDGEIIRLHTIQARTDAPAGTGTRYMEELTALADASGMTIALQTATAGDLKKGQYKKTSSMKRLQEFYGRFGFKSNYGKRNYRSDLPGNMHRTPRETILAASKAEPAAESVKPDTTGWKAEKTAARWKVTDSTGKHIANVPVGIATPELAIAEAARQLGEAKTPSGFGPFIRLKLNRLYLGTADVFRRTPGLERLGDAIAKHVDRARHHGAVLAKPYRDWRKKYSKADQARGMKESETFYAAQDNGQLEAAEQAYALSSNAGRELIDLWRNGTAVLADRMNHQLNLSVFDPNTKTERKIGSVKNYFPRVMRPDILKALDNPSRNPKLFEEIVDAFMEEGLISNRDEALNFISRNINTTKSFSHLGNIETARTLKLPNKMYDYSFNAQLGYMRAISERWGQIEAYGQKTKENPKDLFDEMAEKTQNQSTKEYIAAVQKRAYGETPNNFWYRIVQGLNIIATGTMLSNPITVGINLISGVGYNASTMGATTSVPEFFRLLTNYRATVEEAYELGVLTDDMMSMAQDVEGMESPALTKMANVTAAALKYTGYNASEEFVRAHGLLTAKAFIRRAIAAHKKNPDGGTAKQYADFIHRNGMDPDALIAEEGAGPLTKTFYRNAVNAAQGGYRFDQVPVFVDHPIGRFLFKYQKWGTQAARNMEINVLQPLRKGNVAPLFTYMMIAWAVGEGIDELKELIFGVPERDVDWDAIGKAMDEDTRKGLEMAASKVMNHMLTAGAGGILGNYYQTFKDVAERSRFKNPMEPPGLAIAKNAGELVMRFKEQGGVLTVRDFDDFFRSQLGIYRTAESALAKGADAAGADFKALQLESRRQDLQWLGMQTRRFAGEIGLESKRTSIGRVAKTPDSPFQRKLIESLQIGDVQTARETLNAHLARFTNPKDRAAELKSIQASVRSRQPLRVGTAGEARRQAFIEWSRENLSKAEFERAIRIDRTYRQSARMLRLMPPDKPVSRPKIQEVLERATRKDRMEE